MFSISDFGNLTANTFPSNAIQAADLTVVNQSLVTKTIGPLQTTDIVGIIASRANLVNQTEFSYTTSNGIGWLGLNIQQLADDGYIQSSVIEMLETSNAAPYTSPNGLGIVPYQATIDPAQAANSINVSASWTGANNINSITDLLGQADTQQKIFQDVLTITYNNLSNSYPSWFMPGNANAQTYTSFVTFLVSVGAGLGNSAITQLAGSYNDSITNNYGINAVQAASLADSPAAAGVGGGSGSGGSGSGSGALAALEAAGLAALISQLSSLNLSQLSSKPIAINASTFLNNLTPKAPSLTGGLPTIPGVSLPSTGGLTNPLSALSGVLNSNPITSAVSGTVDRSSLTAAVNKIVVDPTDPNAGKIMVPAFSVPSAADLKTLASSVPSGSILNQLEAQANTIASQSSQLQSQLNIGSLTSAATTAATTLKSIAGKIV